MKNSLALLGLLALGAAFLIPSGDFPWSSFGRELVAGGGVLLMVGAAVRQALRDRRSLARWPPLATLTFAGALSAWLMWMVGQLPFLGDALLMSAYLAAFAACVVVGASQSAAARERLIDAVCLMWLVAALVSLPIAALQWLKLVSNTGWLSSDLPVFGGRPTGQLGQPNMLCLLFLLALSGIWRWFEQRRLSATVASGLAALLLFGALLTQSRLAWLAAPALAAWCGLGGHRHTMRLRMRWVVAAAAVFGLASWALPALNDALGLTGAALEERLSSGRRPQVWALFVDAALQRPWLGWGWLQNGSAQMAVAPTHPSVGWVFSSAHNVVLDLMIWLGIPLGLACAAWLLWGLWRMAVRAGNAPAWVALWAPIVVGVHSLIELPEMYGYVIWPLGLYLGALSVPGPGPKEPDVTPRMAGTWAWGGLVAVGAALWLAVGHEYTMLQEARPTLSAPRPFAHAVLVAAPPVPNVRLLDHLREFHRFAAMPVSPSLDDETVAWMDRVVHRFPFASSLERQARLLALAGRPGEARAALARVCLVTPERACDASRKAWQDLQSEHPELPDWPSK